MIDLSKKIGEMTGNELLGFLDFFYSQMNEKQNTRFISGAKAIADTLGCSTATVYRYAKKKKHGCQVVGGKVICNSTKIFK